MELALVLGVVLLALIFEYINGFHDTANSIATVVATKVLSPGQAVMLAVILCVICNFSFITAQIKWEKFKQIDHKRQ